MHKHIWIHIYILEIKQIKLFACLNIHSLGDYCRFLSPFLSSMPRFWITYLCFIIIIIIFIYLCTVHKVKTNFKSNFQKRHDRELGLQCNSVSVKNGEKIRPPPPPHINMQSRPTGTIPVRIKCCVLVFKRTMPGQRSSEQMCV